MTTAHDADFTALCAAMLSEAIGIDLFDFEAVRPLLGRPLGRLPRPCVALDYLADCDPASLPGIQPRPELVVAPDYPDWPDAVRQWEAALSDERSYLWADPDTWTINLIADDQDITSDDWRPPVAYGRWDFALCPLPLPPGQASEATMPEAQVRVAAEMACRYGHLWAARFCGWLGGPVAPSQIDEITGVCDYPRTISGIDAPSVHEDGYVMHTTASNRLSWAISPDADHAWLEISRPQGIVFRFEIAKSESRGWLAYWERGSADVPTFDRHLTDARHAASCLLSAMRSAHRDIEEELDAVANSVPEYNHLAGPTDEPPESGPGFFRQGDFYQSGVVLTDGVDGVICPDRDFRENEEQWCRAWKAVRAGSPLADALRKFDLSAQEITQ